MGLLIFLIVAIVVIGLLVYAEGLLPMDPNFIRIVQVLTVLVGVLVIVNRAGLI